ncbi:aldolase/citrate lyase family protein [Aminobacter sp. AP02]|uniref:aldolase/citrate lyase family protein n=1 Tax=Aminobacter sp. AP02 TaxID=2135737 RepID=UPI000D6D041C|nr:aldolase/citrate lyase family protein [Aminobacter sp. AP02]PWK61284.1 4-hydroxy-2-oxoheptanedioate aldolase [Aminobacter sp. AP02]
MSGAPRNKMIEMLRSGKPVFGGALHCGDIAGARSYGDSNLDYVMLDLEHEGFDMPKLGDTLQWLVSRRRMAATGEMFPSPTPLVRLPHHGNERIRWIASQALDYGALGIILPYAESGEDVAQLVDAMRYARKEKDGTIVGERRVWPKLAMRYWGYDKFEEYRDMADLWPVAPAGELALVTIVATPKAFDNLEEIAATPGVSAMMFGAKHAWHAFAKTGKIDLEDRDLVEFRNRMLAACKKNGIAAGTSLSATPPKGAGGKGAVDVSFLQRRIDEGFRVFLTQGGSRPAELDQA